MTSYLKGERVVDGQGRKGTIRDLYLQQMKRKVEWDDGTTSVVRLGEVSYAHE